jgi:ferredoxin
LVKVSVDNDLCTGHARCWSLAPEVFTIDENGYSDIGIGKHVPPDHEEKAQLGVRSCPERALSLDD